MKVKELIEYEEKSKIKAGEAVEKGKYPFFTSSEAENKRYNEYTCDTEGIIMGTGGNATLHYYNGKFAVSTDCLVLKTNQNVKCKYLYYFFKANMKVLQDGFKGAGLKHTNKNYIENIELNMLPNINEQLVIIERLDRINNIIQKHKKVINCLNTLIKARFVEMFGDPILNDKQLKKSKLIEECDIITGNTPSRNHKEYYGNYIEWIKSDNINTSNVFLTNAEECLSKEGLNIGRSADEGSILMTCIAGSLKCIGNVAIANRKVAFNQQINAIVSKNNNPYYLYYLFTFSKPMIQSTIDMALKGILSKGKLSILEFIFPPIELQNEFADFVHQVEKMKADVKHSLDKTKLLFDSLMQEYFE